MSRQKAGAAPILANMVHLLTGKAAAGVMSLIYIAIAARSLGVTQYGVLNLVHGYATFLGGVIAFSGFHGLVRYGAEALERNEPLRLQSLILLMSATELVMAVLAIAIAMAIVPYVGKSMEWPEQAIHFGSIYCLAILATVRATPQGLLQLANRFDLIGLHQAIMPLTRLIGSLILWVWDGDLTAFLTVWLISALIEGASMWLMGLWVLRKMRLEGKGWTTLHGVRRDNPGIIRFMFVTNADLTLRDLAPKATPLMIGWILGPGAAGLFTLAQRATAVLAQPAQMLGQAGYVVIAKLAVASRFDAIRHTIRRTISIAIGASVVTAALMILFGRQILTMLGGPEFAGGAALLGLLTLGRAIMAGTPTISAAITALGRPEDSVAANIVINLVLLPLLVPLLWAFGVNGAGWHSMIQAVVLVALLQWKYVGAMNAARNRLQAAM